MNSRPFIALAINLPNYATRSRMESITKHIPRADAKWLAQRLSQLSEEQLRDCFRAGGYTPEEVEGYTLAVQKRIAELNQL
jgi:DNA-binding HxlR family transcriptional regulator